LRYLKVETFNNQSFKLNQNYHLFRRLMEKFKKMIGLITVNLMDFNFVPYH